MDLKEFEENADLQNKLRSLCEFLNLNPSFGEISTMMRWVEMLKKQNHTAESIACYLTLRTIVYCDVEELGEALIKLKIVDN